MENFIKTNDSATAELLRKNGFQELPKSGSFFMFINQPNNINFSAEDKKKMVFTNIMSV